MLLASNMEILLLTTWSISAEIIGSPAYLENFRWALFGIMNTCLCVKCRQDMLSVTQFPALPAYAVYVYSNSLHIPFVLIFFFSVLMWIVPTVVQGGPHVIVLPSKDMARCSCTWWRRTQTWQQRIMQGGMLGRPLGQANGRLMCLDYWRVTSKVFSIIAIQ